MSNSPTYYGVSFGSALAIAVSMQMNNHIGWAIFHGLFSWLYVIYAATYLR